MPSHHRLAILLLALALALVSLPAAEERRQVFRLDDGREFYGYVAEENAQSTVIVSELSTDEGVIQARVSVDNARIASVSDAAGPPPKVGEPIDRPADGQAPSTPSERDQKLHEHQRALAAARLERARASITEAQAKLADFAARQQRLNQGFEAARAMHQKFTQQLAAAEKALRDAQSDANREAQRSNDQRASSETLRRIDKAQAEAKKHRDGIAQVEAEARAAQAEAQTLEARRSRLEGDLRLMQSRLTLLEAEQSKSDAAAGDGAAADATPPGAE